MRAINISYLNRMDVARVALTDDDILNAVEVALRAQGNGETVLEPRVHLVPESSDKGHFNVLRGVVRPLGVAGVKVVGDFYENYKHDLPSEVAVLTLFDPTTGIPLALIDATAITEQRTGAVTAIGAKHLARKASRVLGHIGARGTAYWNVRLLDHLFDFAEIRVHSRRPESRDAFAATLAKDLGQARAGRFVLGSVRARRRYRRRSLALADARAASENRMDQARCSGGALRDHERGRALAHRYHEQDGRG
jgi:ornithine cyclodeaminase